MNESFIKPDDVNEFAASNNNNTSSSIFKNNEEKTEDLNIVHQKEKQEVKEVSFRYLVILK